MKSIVLDVGEDRLVVHVDPDRFYLDLDLPADVKNETCGAQFNKKLKVLIYSILCLIIVYEMFVTHLTIFQSQNLSKGVTNISCNKVYRILYAESYI